MISSKDAAETECQSEGTLMWDHFAKEGLTVIAGPCSVESEEQMMEIAAAVKRAGATVLRGGAFKPRTSPYSFQGLGRFGLEYLRKAGKSVGLPIVTEVMDTRDVSLVAEYADILQIGARNMQNFPLLIEVGKTDKPVILKNSLYATIDEWLNCAEYITKEGNPRVILCERGHRSVETHTRNTLDLSSVPVLHKLKKFPVVVDPSHATGRQDLIEPMCLSAIMAGCDGLMIEVHPDPKSAKSDAEQQLTPEQFSKLMRKIKSAVEFRKQLALSV